MKIFDLLPESLRTERIRQHHVASELRALYDDRREIKRELNDARITGDDEDEVTSLVQQLVDVDERIRQLEDVDLTEQLRYDNLETWKRVAKSRGWVVKPMAHPTSGESGSYYIAKDAEGNNKGHFDASGLPSVRQGILKEYAGVNEAKNHMGDREYQTYGGWKAACKKAYPDCSFRGDRDIGAAVVGNKDVGEWDGAIGSVYAKTVVEAYENDKEAIGRIKASIERFEAKAKEAEDDWKAFRSAARTDDEQEAATALGDTAKRIRRTLDRLRDSLKLRTAGVMESKKDTVRRKDK